MASKIVSFLKYLAKRFVDKLAGKIVDKSFYALSIFAALIWITAVMTNACPPLPRVAATLQQNINPTVTVAPQLNAPLFSIEVNINSNNTNNNTFVLNTPPRFETAPVQTEDRCGKKLDIVLGMLSDPYRWLYASDSKVGISLNESWDVSEVFLRLPNDIEQPVVAVGLASHEHHADDPQAENARAQRRVDNLIKYAGERFTVKRPELYSLNLGYYARQSRMSREESAIERRVILMAVLKREGDADLNSGVRNALIKMKAEKKLVEGFDPDAYSNFVPEAFAVVPRSPNAHNTPVPCAVTTGR